MKTSLYQDERESLSNLFAFFLGFGNEILPNVGSFNISAYDDDGRKKKKKKPTIKHQQSSSPGDKNRNKAHLSPWKRSTIRGGHICPFGLISVFESFVEIF